MYINNLLTFVDLRVEIRHLHDTSLGSLRTCRGDGFLGLWNSNDIRSLRVSHERVCRRHNGPAKNLYVRWSRARSGWSSL